MANATNNDGLSQAWYIRVRGRIIGPFDAARLKVLRSRGQFSRAHEVSTDMVNWQSASSIDHLFQSKRQEAAAADPVVVENTPVVPSAPAPPQAPGRAWYYILNGEQHGPVSSRELKDLLNAGVMTGDVDVWRDGLDDWLPLDSVPEFRTTAPPRRPLAVAGMAVPSAQKYCFACGSPVDVRAELCPKCGVRQRTTHAGKSRVTAAILAFFLGGIGMHHFYLGNVVLGVLYLLFCWTFIPGIIAFVEAIVFACSSDESFDAKYNRK